MTSYEHVIQNNRV